MKKMNLKGLTSDEIEHLVISQGEKRFRANQLFAWIYRRNALTFEEMTDISKGFRSKLNEVAEIGQLKLVRTVQSNLTKTQKFLFELPDGHRIETVLMEEELRLTACLSTQVGCALGCSFCATARLGFHRNLEAWEIVDQLLAVKRLSGKNPTNVVIMGMGEPFLNYENVIKACHLLNHPDGAAISHRKIVISTSGIVPRIVQYADEKQPFKLAISLNAPTGIQRSKIMPINKKYPLEKLMDAVKYYAQRSRLRVTFEYILLKGFNDRPEDAIQLKKLVQGLRCKINLIPLNPVHQRDPQPDEVRINQFYAYFREFPAVVSVRWSKGTDIEAACGQLAARD